MVALTVPVVGVGRSGTIALGKKAKAFGNCRSGRVVTFEQSARPGQLVAGLDFAADRSDLGGTVLIPNELRRPCDG